MIGFCQMKPNVAQPMVMVFCPASDLTVKKAPLLILRTASSAMLITFISFIFSSSEMPAGLFVSASAGIPPCGRFFSGSLSPWPVLRQDACQTINALAGQVKREKKPGASAFNRGSSGP